MLIPKRSAWMCAVFPMSTIASPSTTIALLRLIFLPPKPRAFEQLGHSHQMPGYSSPAEVPKNVIFMLSPVVQAGSPAWFRLCDPL